MKYDQSRCVGCGRCAEVCPHAVFSIEGGKASLADKDACIECGACQKNCPAKAISVRAGVGCAAAIIGSLGSGKEPCCGDGGGCCG